jgi:hypothetical protein
MEIAFLPALWFWQTITQLSCQIRFRRFLNLICAALSRTSDWPSENDLASHHPNASVGKCHHANSAFPNIALMALISNAIAMNAANSSHAPPVILLIPFSISSLFLRILAPRRGIEPLFQFCFYE